MDERDERDERDDDELDGTCTDPERFGVATEAARALVDELVSGYEVTRVDGTDLDAHVARGWPGSPAVRLDPVGGGAPVVVIFTAFPGVHLRAGHDLHVGYPSCGCDGCAEDPDEVVRDLIDDVRCVVSGGLTESRRKRRLRADVYETRLVGHDGWRGWGPSPEKEDRPIPVGTTTWPPWLRRR